MLIDSLMIDGDIDVTIQRGERTVELNTKYEGLNSIISSQTLQFNNGKARTSDRGVSLIHSSISR
jgi:hypothetical protein